MVDTTKQIESLSGRKRELFEILMREKASKAKRGQSIRRREALEHAPLSYNQQQMWILSQLDQDGGHYNQAASIRIKGNVDVSALERAIEEIIRRHESLRTVYRAVGGQPVQIVIPAGPFKLDSLDLRQMPDPQRQQRATEISLQEGREGFDLERGPVMRVKVVRMSDEEVIVLVSMHHICTDGWSMGIFMKEMGQLYDSYSRGEEGRLEELSIQYGDYAVWQREQVEGGGMEEQVRYWRRQLEGAPMVLELPTDRPRPARESFDAGEERFELGAELSEELRSMSRREGVTLYMTLLAGFKAMLHRYSGQEDIVVGTPVANRGKAELEGLIGYFVNTLVMRTDLGGDPTFKELLMRVRDTTLAAYAHQTLPIEKLMEELAIKRDLTRMTLHQAAFNLMNVVNHSMEFSDVVMSRTELPVRAKLDWLLEMVNAKEGLKGWLVYKTDMVDKTTAERMVENYRTLLREVARNPNLRLSRIPLLSESASLHIDSSSSRRSDFALPHHTFVELFHSQVERSLHSTAATHHLHRLSYEELNRAANRLASLLIEHGVGPDEVVGLLAPRDLNLLTAVLAVLKAGGAYLPLDPLYPVDRLRQVLTQSGVRLILTTREFARQVGNCLSECDEAERPRVLEIEELLARQQGPEAERNPPVRSGLSNLAYVIYTSGSTGMPKGVMIEQRGMINHLQVKINDLEMSSTDRVGQTASQCFDISVWQMLAALLVGGEVDIFDEEESRNAGSLVEKVVAGELTIIEVVPSLLRAMLDVMDTRRVGAEELKKLRWLVVTGEALPGELCERWLKRYSHTPIVNAYGPTECSDDVTQEMIREWDAEAGQSVPIGRAVANTNVYVLDRWMQPVPVGVIGEIYVGGAGVGRGYLGEAAKTAEVFLPDPYGESGERLYKTGDIGRRLADGRLEYRGRVDHQVKVRGFRIELGEIEVSMRRQSWVKEAVVDLREDKGGEKRLVGYVVTEGGERDVTREMRDELSRMLPEYMVPSVYVRIEEVPLNRSGKVERGRLPEPEWGRAGEEEGKQKARTPIEGILAGIWSEVLGVSEVGVDENFFELGGHSLLAMQVIWRASDLFNASLSLRDLFESPTVAGLAAVVEETIKGGRRESTAIIQTRPRNGALPASFSQERMWFLDQMAIGDAAYNICAGLRLVGRLDIDALERAIEEIIRRHESLRTVYRAVGGQPVQIVIPAGPFKLDSLDLRQMPDPQRQQRATEISLQEGREGFDLERGPVMRVKVVRMSDEEVIVLVSMHHICTDGWSMGIFMKEMGQLYDSYSRGEEGRLEELSIQYGDYAVWQREQVEGGGMEEQVRYWRRQLEGAPMVLELPTDRPRPAVQSYAGGSEAIWIDERVTEELKRLSRAEGVTLYMSLLAAYNVLLMRYSNQEEIVVGADIANRGRREVEPLIGFFINMLVMRADLRGEPTFRELLSRVREVTLGAYAHQDLPFEKLVEELQPERSLSHSPLFQVSFVLQNAPVGKPELPGLVIERLETDSEAAKFDLELSLVETEGGLAGAILYNSDLFDREMIRRMADHYVRIVEAALADPDVAITAIQMLNQQERDQILIDWNDTAGPYQRRTRIHKLIEQQAERQPQAVALKDHDQQISYQLLNTRANQLAHHLMSLGVEPGAIVGIYLHRSLQMIISMLAVLKAGAAYVPLDPKLPADRVKFIVEDSAVEAVICQQADREAVEQLGVTQVMLERDEQRISLHSRSNPRVETPDKGLVYVMYTSGSTGRPKGVEVTHEALCWLVWNLDHLEIRQDDVVAQASNASFDAIIYEVWGGLAHGARVVLVSPEEMLISEELMRRLAQERITVMYLTAALFAQVVRQEPGAFSSLRVLACGGEAMDARCARAILAAGGPEHLIHEYGPTEATVFATQYEVKEVREEGKRVPIGRAMSNTKAYLLDRRLEPVAVGVGGELYIGGDCVAGGYRRNAGQTAERFMPDPYSGIPGARMYRTGDVVRHIGGGEIEFIGRADDQVKVRGYRIELAEVRAAITEQEDVKDAVVMVREDEQTGKRLVAYVVMEESGSLEQVKRRVKERLPEYMVPSVYVRIEEVPLSRSGKVERGRLPEPEWGRAGEEEGKQKARTPIEGILAGIWSEVLGVSEVGVDENFFDLGGHSLLVVRIISLVRETLQVEISLRDLFESPTVAGLAALVESAVMKGLTAPPIRKASRDSGVSVSFTQQGTLTYTQSGISDPAENLAICIRFSGFLNVAALEKSITEIVRRHEILRTTFEEDKGQILQVVHSPRPFKADIIDLMNLPEGDPEEAALEMTRQATLEPFDLEKGPVWRVSLYRISKRQHILSWMMHHFLMDPWSLDVLLQELSVLYETYSHDQPSTLPELPVQYADYTLWQKGWLQGEVFDRHASYWKDKLQGDLETLNLPTDFERPQVQTFRSVSHSFEIPDLLAGRVKDICSEYAVTPFMVLLSVLKLLVYKYTDQESILICSGTANRNRIELEPLIGLFSNNIPFRTTVSDNLSFRELLMKVRETSLEAYVHQALTISQIEEVLQAEGWNTKGLRSAVAFGLVPVPATRRALPDSSTSSVDIELVPVNTATTAVDLNLTLYETPAGYRASLIAKADLFKPTTLAKIGNDYLWLLRRVVDDPEQFIADLSLASAADAG